MNTNHAVPSCQNCSGSLSIRFDSLPFDPRATYVQTVCDLLIDSRFGPGRYMPMVYHFSQRQPVHRQVLYDMTPAGPVPSYTILPDSEIARRHAFVSIQDAIAEYRQVNGIAVHVQTTSPATLGRGSP